MRVRTRSWLLILVVLLVVAAGCGRPSANGNPDQFTMYSRPGPYSAGTFQVDVGGDPVVVWYPAGKSAAAGVSTYAYHLRSWAPPAISALVPSSFADAVPEDAYQGLPMAKGAFPIVLFSHGYGGYPEQSSFLTAHLATWGMIVVAPDQQQRDVSSTILGRAEQVNPGSDITEQLDALSYVEQQDHANGSVFYGHVEATMVAALGHSAGGGTAVRIAAADPAVRGWIALAGVSAPQPAKAVPSLMISGSADKTVPTSDVRRFYDSVRGNKRLLVIDGYGHNVFDDICTINHAHGGISAAIESLHLPVPPAITQLATDGCLPPDSYPPHAWPLIDQAVTAQLLYDFHVNSGPRGLGPPLEKAYQGVRATYVAAS